MEQIDNYVRYLPLEQKVLYGLAKENGEMIWEFGQPYPGNFRKKRPERTIYSKEKILNIILWSIFDIIFMSMNG